METTKQKIIGIKGLVVLIALLSAFVPLSTDLYLPALPTMSANFGVGPERTNLTLTMFFVFYALGTLIWGPLSDLYGRKPILLIGLSLYIAASLACVFVNSIDALIIFRIFQAIGGSAAGAVATAIVKDSYSGKKRMSILAIVQSMVLFSPALAPVLGAFLLKVMSWRGVFMTLTGIGVLALVGSLLFTESILVRNTGSLLPSMLRLGHVLKNRGFAMLLIMFSIGSLSTMAFVASSTYIYQEGFNLSGQAYSFYFSLNAIGLILGPMIFLRLSNRVHSETIIRACYIIIALGGVLVCLLGSLQPWIFALCMLPVSTAGSCFRSPATNMLLEQQKGDSGAVSSLMGCTAMLMGSLGTQIISQPWNNMILALGVMIISTASIALIAWPFVIKRVVRQPGLKEQTLKTVEIEAN
ncbi:MAG: MFS transporter [Chloroflexi bacterium HGW-Chloroflexi-4]|nr:MAG: MFS transporter [Chloroflexi bacterium HGW-Chloroflexi-4]